MKGASVDNQPAGQPVAVPFMELAVKKRLLSKNEVCALLGVSRSTLWRMIGAGRFPEPVELSPGRKGHPTDEVDQWIADRKAARGPTT